MEPLRITWSVGQSTLKFTENGKTYEIKDTNNDKHLSETEIQEALRGKDLDNMSTDLLDIINALSKSKNENGRSFETIRKNMEELSTQTSPIETELKNRELEKTKRRELKEKYYKLQNEKTQYEQILSGYEVIQKQAEFQQNQMLMMQQLPGFYNEPSILSGLYGYEMFGGMPTFNAGGYNPFGGYNSGISSKADIDKLAQKINTEIDEFKTELDSLEITLDDLLNDTGKMKLNFQPKIIIEEAKINEEQPKTTTSPAKTSQAEKSEEVPVNNTQNGKTETPPAESSTKSNEEKSVTAASEKNAEANKNTAQEAKIAEIKKTAEHIAAVYAEEIGDTVFDRDKVDEVKNKINKDNVLYVLLSYERIAQDRNWLRNDGSPETLWDGIRNEWSTSDYKYTMFKPIVNAILEKAKELGVDVEEDNDLRGLRNALDYEYKKPWYKDTDEDLVQKKFDAAYGRLQLLVLLDNEKNNNN